MARIADLTLDNLFADGSGTANDLANFKLAAEQYRHAHGCSEDEAIDAIYRDGDFWARVETWATIPGVDGALAAATATAATAPQENPMTEPRAPRDRTGRRVFRRVGALLALPTFLEGPDVWLNVGSITSVTMSTATTAQGEEEPVAVLVEAAGQRHEVLPDLTDVLHAVADAALAWRREQASAEEEGRLLTRDAQRLPSLSRGNLDRPWG